MLVFDFFHFLNHGIPHLIDQVNARFIQAGKPQQTIDWSGKREYAVNLIPPSIIQIVLFILNAFRISSIAYLQVFQDLFSEFETPEHN